jgi:short-subunit dehydrogenase
MPVGPLDEEDDASAIRLLEINLHAVIHGTKEAMRRMKPRGTGHIVNVASTAGKAGVPHLATYCATKHAVVGLSEAVRGELRGTGVEISVLLPHFVRTELIAGIDETRTIPHSTPEQVADAAIDALRFNRYEVWIPKHVGPTWALSNLLPRRARDVLGRVLKLDRALVDADRAARAAYEARAAASAPATEPVIEETGADREAA